jgi:shikimate dehydrogenase
MNGDMVLLHQGAAAFELWTGRPAPMDLMRQQLEAARSGELQPAAAAEQG